MADNGWIGGICHAEPGLPKLLILSLERIGVVDPPEFVYREYDSKGTLRLELPLNHTQPIVCIQGVADPAKVVGLVRRKAVSLSFMVCSRDRLFMRALASVSKMRVWL